MGISLGNCATLVETAKAICVKRHKKSGGRMYERIQSEIHADKYYASNFANEGQQFVAWYLR
ncbi:MAG: hypothetical protein ACRED7_04425, partial [Stellaceae bacterium]